MAVSGATLKPAATPTATGSSKSSGGSDAGKATQPSKQQGNTKTQQQQQQPAKKKEAPPQQNPLQSFVGGAGDLWNKGTAAVSNTAKNLATSAGNAVLGALPHTTTLAAGTADASANKKKSVQGNNPPTVSTTPTTVQQRPVTKKLDAKPQQNPLQSFTGWVGDVYNKGAAAVGNGLNTVKNVATNVATNAANTALGALPHSSTSAAAATPPATSGGLTKEAWDAYSNFRKEEEADQVTSQVNNNAGDARHLTDQSVRSLPTDPTQSYNQAGGAVHAANGAQDGATYLNALFRDNAGLQGVYAPPAQQTANNATEYVSSGIAKNTKALNNASDAVTGQSNRTAGVKAPDTKTFKTSQVQAGTNQTLFDQSKNFEQLGHTLKAPTPKTRQSLNAVHDSTANIATNTAHTWGNVDKVAAGVTAQNQKTIDRQLNPKQPDYAGAVDTATASGDIQRQAGVALDQAKHAANYFNSGTNAPANARDAQRSRTAQGFVDTAGRNFVNTTNNTVPVLLKGTDAADHAANNWNGQTQAATAPQTIVDDATHSRQFSESANGLTGDLQRIGADPRLQGKIKSNMPEAINTAQGHADNAGNAADNAADTAFFPIVNGQVNGIRSSADDVNARYNDYVANPSPVNQQAFESAVNKWRNTTTGGYYAGGDTFSPNIKGAALNQLTDSYVSQLDPGVRNMLFTGGPNGPQTLGDQLQQTAGNVAGMPTLTRQSNEALYRYQNDAQDRMNRGPVPNSELAAAQAPVDAAFERERQGQLKEHNYDGLGVLTPEQRQQMQTEMRSNHGVTSTDPADPNHVLGQYIDGQWKDVGTPLSLTPAQYQPPAQQSKGLNNPALNALGAAAAKVYGTNPFQKVGDMIDQAHDQPQQFWSQYGGDNWWGKTRATVDGFGQFLGGLSNAQRSWGDRLADWVDKGVSPHAGLLGPVIHGATSAYKGLNDLRTSGPAYAGDIISMAVNDRKRSNFQASERAFGGASAPYIDKAVDSVFSADPNAMAEQRAQAKRDGVDKWAVYPVMDRISQTANDIGNGARAIPKNVYSTLAGLGGALLFNPGGEKTVSPQTVADDYTQQMHKDPAGTLGYTLGTLVGGHSVGDRLANSGDRVPLEVDQRQTQPLDPQAPGAQGGGGASNASGTNTAAPTTPLNPAGQVQPHIADQQTQPLLDPDATQPRLSAVPQSALLTPEQRRIAAQDTQPLVPPNTGGTHIAKPPVTADQTTQPLPDANATQPLATLSPEAAARANKTPEQRRRESIAGRDTQPLVTHVADQKTQPLTDPDATQPRVPVAQQGGLLSPEQRRIAGQDTQPLVPQATNAPTNANTQPGVHAADVKTLPLRDPDATQPLPTLDPDSAAYQRALMTPEQRQALGVRNRTLDQMQAINPRTGRPSFWNGAGIALQHALKTGDWSLLNEWRTKGPQEARLRQSVSQNDPIPSAVSKLAGDTDLPVGGLGKGANNLTLSSRANFGDFFRDIPKKGPWRAATDNFHAQSDHAGEDANNNLPSLKARGLFPINKGAYFQARVPDMHNQSLAELAGDPAQSGVEVVPTGTYEIGNTTNANGDPVTAMGVTYRNQLKRMDADPNAKADFFGNAIDPSKRYVALGGDGYLAREYGTGLSLSLKPAARLVGLAGKYMFGLPNKWVDNVPGLSYDQNTEINGPIHIPGGSIVEEHVADMIDHSMNTQNHFEFLTDSALAQALRDGPLNRFVPEFQQAVANGAIDPSQIQFRIPADARDPLNFHEPVNGSGYSTLHGNGMQLLTEGEDPLGNRVYNVNPAGARANARGQDSYGRIPNPDAALSAAGSRPAYWPVDANMSFNQLLTGKGRLLNPLVENRLGIGASGLPAAVGAKGVSPSWFMSRRRDPGVSGILLGEADKLTPMEFNVGGTTKTLEVPAWVKELNDLTSVNSGGRNAVLTPYVPDGAKMYDAQSGGYAPVQTAKDRLSGYFDYLQTQATPAQQPLIDQLRQDVLPYFDTSKNMLLTPQASQEFYDTLSQLAQ